MEQRVQVAVSPNPIKIAERLDLDGHIIDPISKRIIKAVE